MRILYPALFVGILAATESVAAATFEPFAGWRSDALNSSSGGIDAGFTHIGQLDFGVEVSTRGLFNQDATILLTAFYNTGGAFTGRVGDFQVVSNIEADGQGLRLNEAWIDQPLPIDGASLLFGKYDLNGEFDVLESAAPFVNSAMGIGSDIGLSGANGPSIFPATGLATRLQISLNDEWHFKLAVIDGVPGDPDSPGDTRVRINGDEGALVVSELTYQAAGYRVFGGYWRYTRAPDPLCDPVVCGASGSNDGLYLRGESTLIDHPGLPQVDGFFRIGSAASGFNPFDRFASAGLLVSSPFATRPDDQFGVAFAYGFTGDEFSQSLVQAGSSSRQAEGVVEITYVARLLPWVAVQPTLQFIDNPGADDTIDDSWIAGMRVEVTLP